MIGFIRVEAKRCFFCFCVFLLTACGLRSGDAEQQIVGEWSWTYIEGVGRLTFTADHKVTEGFPPDDKDGTNLSGEEFQILRSGTWRLERGVLVTEVDNRPLITILKGLTPWDLPPFQKWVDRRRIVRIDEQRVVFDDGHVFTRVHLSK
ncbi:MAG: hypothetical protein ABI839_05825 [Verrucomicrobiota bacterium]